MSMLDRVESALRDGNDQLANDLLMEEWNRVGDPAHIYYRTVRDGLVATFRHLEASSEFCSQWESFCHCSNALLELDVKNVAFSEEMEVLVLYMLSSYGLWRLCGDPADEEKKIDWRDSVERVVRWVEELRQREKCYDFLDIDDHAMYRVRMIHNHLFFVKNRAELRGLPLRELIFCVGIFARAYHQYPENVMYRMIINKRNVMQFLLAIVSRMKGVLNPDQHVKHRKASVLKKLRKTYRRLKQVHSVNKIMRYVKIRKEFDNSDYTRSNAPITLAAFKRFNQICGEAIKNTVDTPNLTAKLTTFLSNMLTEGILLLSRFRNFSCHGFPLSQLFQRDADEMIFYRNLISYIQLTAEMFYSVSLFMLFDCYRYLYGLMRRCRTIEDLCALIRYVGSDTIRPLHESQIEDDKDFNEATDDLLDTHSNLLMEVEMMAFTNAPIAAIRFHMYRKLTDKTVLDILMADQKPLPLNKSSAHHYYVQRQMELNRESTEQWRYRERTRQTLTHFTEDSGMDVPNCDILEDKLHAVLSKTRNGYYRNVFALDSKVQAIKETLKAALIGPKTSNDFKMRNNRFKLKLATLRQQDEEELQMAFHKIILNLQDAFKRSRCDTIDQLIKNHEKMSLKFRLAIEYWQLQAMEILCSTGYFGDNFHLFTKSIPMIWGKSYRNYLAHDCLSYDLLTSSGSLKVLVNGFVLAFDSTELNIFSRSPKFKLDGLATVETGGFQWLEIQAKLLSSIRNGDRDQLVSCLNLGAEMSGRHLLALGHLLPPMFHDLRTINVHAQYDRTHIDRLTLALNRQFHSDINLAVHLNLLQIENLPIQEAILQLEKLQPNLIAPCLGTVLSHLVSAGNIALLKTLVDRYVKSQFLCVHQMTRSCMLLDPKYFANIPLKDQLSVAILMNNIALFEDLVHSGSSSSDAALDRSDLLKKSLEGCCHHGRLEMARCILDSGLKCDHQVMSVCLKKAINQRHWSIVELLELCGFVAVRSGAGVWFDEDLVLQVIAKRNFKLMRRRVLTAPIPADLMKKIVKQVARSGSRKLLHHLFLIGVDIWACSSVLSSALKNESSDVLEYLEDKVFQPIGSSFHKGLSYWIGMFQDLKTLMILSLDPEFISSLILNSLIIERWAKRTINLLKTDDVHFAESFHFKYPNGFFCIELPTHHTTTEHRILQKCLSLTGKIQRLPKDLHISEVTMCSVISCPDITMQADVELTFYCATPYSHHFVGLPVITHDSSHHIAVSIANCLENYLSNFPHVTAVTATITATDDTKFQRLFYIQIDSSSCILQQSFQNQLKIPFLFNKPGQRNILHNIQPDTAPAVVDSLLKLGADPAHLNGRHETAFHTALARPFPLALIKLMHFHHIKSHRPPATNVFNLRDVDGYTPLQAAVTINSYEVADFMLRNGADPILANRRGDAALLGLAVLNRNVRIVQLLIRSCPRLVRLFIHTEERKTVLEVAVRINHDHLVRLLLEHGAELNHRNASNCTALTCAIKCETVDALQSLLSFAIREGVTMDNDVDGFGKTALEYAKENGSCPEVVRALVCYSVQQGFLNLVEFCERWKIHLSNYQ